MSEPVRERDLPWSEGAHGKTYHHRRKALAQPAGGEQIGASLYELEPGMRSFPLHAHCANEEAIYVLAGSGTLRLPDREFPLEPGTYAALPRGPEHAHQVTNTGDETLRYLCLSTQIEPEVVIYPDSDKVGLFAGTAPGGDKSKRYVNRFVRYSHEVDYFDSEE